MDNMISIAKHLHFMIQVDNYSGLTVAYPMQRRTIFKFKQVNSARAEVWYRAWLV